LEGRKRLPAVTFSGKARLNRKVMVLLILASFFRGIRSSMKCRELGEE
jgi:hypothetical protein